MIKSHSNPAISKGHNIEILIIKSKVDKLRDLCASVRENPEFRQMNLSADLIN